MKTSLLLWWGLLLAAAGTAVAAPAGLLVDLHFAGGPAIAADTNALAFSNLWCTAEAQALRHQTLDKLARAPYDRFKQKIVPGAGDEAELFRPLLDDGLNAEWFFQMREATNGAPQCSLAIHLPVGRARLWETNLATALAAWTGLSVQQNPSGWILKKHVPPNLIGFVRAGDWVVLGCGQDELSLSGEMVKRIQAGQRPAPVETNAWLTADLDWPRLYTWLPAFKALDLPEVRVRLTGQDGNLRWNGKLIFPQPLALTLEPWRMPMKTINMPLGSFAAVRGIAPWLQKQAWWQPYASSLLPNQLFIWSVDQMALQTFAAAPVANGKKVIAELGQKFSAHTNQLKGFELPLTTDATNDQISWRGIPMVAPNLQLLQESSGDYLFASVFPNVPPNRPLPPDLLDQLASSNLVYYHWEVTSERLKQLPQLTQLVLMLTRHRQLDVKSPAGKWLNQIGPSLGNTVTEIKQTAPNELTLHRKAPAGFTALELIALASWLEATNFPGCNLDLPPPFRRRRPPTQPTNAPPAQVPVASPAAPRSAP
ncbi:MAG TPA: hypothetical protein VMB80_17930 [Candidatus Acidoferrum sp.]|nr:hypothetical protein [Candidatus Acidoferrum sp.]